MKLLGKIPNRTLAFAAAVALTVCGIGLSFGLGFGIKTSKAASGDEAEVSGAIITAIESTQTLVQSNYTTVTWGTLQSAISHAQTTHDDEEATLHELQMALTTLENAIDNLKTQAYADLETLVTTLSVVPKPISPYDGPWENLQTAVDIAQVVLDSATTKDISKIGALTTAKGNLQTAFNVFEADCHIINKNTKLAEISWLIGLINDLAEEDYTPESWARLQNAINDAEALTVADELEDINTTLEELYSAYMELRKNSDLPPDNCEHCGKDPCECPPPPCEDCGEWPCECSPISLPIMTPEELLVLAVDELGTLIEDVDGLTQEHYSIASWAGLQDALTAALTALESGDLEKITEAIEALNVAILNLKQPAALSKPTKDSLGPAEVGAIAAAGCVVVGAPFVIWLWPRRKQSYSELPSK